MQGVWRGAVWPHRRERLLHRDGRQQAHSTGFGWSQLSALSGYSAPRPKGTAMTSLGVGGVLLFNRSGWYYRTASWASPTYVKRTGFSHSGETDDASRLSCLLSKGFSFSSFRLDDWKGSTQMVHEHTRTDPILTNAFPSLFQAWEPAVLQSPRRIKNHDQRLWLIEDGGNRWRDGHRLWDSRIRWWGHPLSSGNSLWDN